MELYLMRGVSCSGKSTWLRNQPDIHPSAILSSDYYRMVYFGDQSYQAGNKILFENIRSIIETRFKHWVERTYVDATHLKMADVKYYLELANLYSARVYVVDVGAPPSKEVLMERNIKRYRKTGLLIPEHVFDNHIKRYHDNMDNFVKAHINTDLTLLRYGLDFT